MSAIASRLSRSRRELLATGLAALGLVALILLPRYDSAWEAGLVSALFASVVWQALRWRAAKEEAERLLGREHEFLRDLSHSLRAPITIARCHAELLRAEPERNGAGDIEIMISELDRLSRISGEIVLLAAPGNRLSLVWAPVDVAELAEETVWRWAAAAQRGVFVEVLAEGSVPADRERLESALDALLENAVKFTSPSDRITIRARAEAGDAVFEVSDTGIGIPADALPSVFDRFTRLGSSTPGGRGTGLGLAVVKAIAEAHGGAVRATSSVGEGTTFELRLPGFESREVVAESVPNQLVGNPLPS